MALKSNIKISLLLHLLLASGIYAQNSGVVDVPAVSKGDIQFYLDHSAFKGNDGKLVVEFYLMLFADQLDVKRSDGKNISEFSVKASLLNSFGNEIKKQEWTTEVSVNDSVSTSDVIYDQWNEELKPGDHRLMVVVSDNNSNKKAEADYSITVDEINSSNFASSQLEFVTRVDDGASAGHFNKSGKSVIPNPSRRYGVLNPVMYVYYELYNLMGSEQLQVNYSVIGKSADTIKSFPPFRLEKSGSSSTVLHGLNVGNIPSGIYNLNVSVKDESANSSINLSRRFEVIQKDFIDLKTEISIKDAEVFEWLLNIFGTEHQQKIYNQLNLNAKAEFMVQFWKNLDPSPGTPENEYLEKIQQRFVYANENFKWSSVEGWKSERGRVLVQYGMPDEVERHYSEAGTVPYEIWQYSEARNFYFVFGDLRSDGRFVLLHSDKEGEVSNKRWFEYVRRM